MAAAFSAEELAILARPGPWTRIESPEAWMVRVAKEEGRRIDEDALEEYLEHLGETLPPPPEVQPEIRRAREGVDFTGRVLGKLSVIGPRFGARRDGKTETAWRVKCSCGRRLIMSASALKRGAQACHRCACTEKNRSRAPLVEGKPSWRVARELGISLGALRKRRARGWTGAKLLSPPLDKHGRPARRVAA